MRWGTILADFLSTRVDRACQIPGALQGCMRHEPVSHKELDEFIGNMSSMPRMIRILAVKAELLEQEKERRDISQEEVAEVFSVGASDIQAWVAQYRKEGVEGLGGGG